MKQTQIIDFKRINNDINGNPRYVCHFLNFASDYTTALNLAREIGGKKFHNKMSVNTKQMVAPMDSKVKMV